MADKKEKALHHLIGKGFSRRNASAILTEIEPDEALGAAPSGADADEAQKHVESFGYHGKAASDIVAKVGAHVVLAHKALDQTKDKSKRPFWDADLDGADEAASKPASKSASK